MAKITKLEQQFKDNKPSGFKIELSDGTAGYLVEKDSDKGLKEGDEVSFTWEVPTGKTYKKITARKAVSSSDAPPPSPQRPTINVGTGKGKQEVKSEGAIKILEVFIQGVWAGKVKESDFKNEVKSNFELLCEMIDEAYSK